MNLKDILAISGKPGLFKFVSQAKNGIIVESLSEKKRMPAYASDKISALEDIAVFTDDKEVSLSELFDIIYEKTDGEKAPSHKLSPDDLKKNFQEILPDYDRSRVYVSDIKKIFQWYNLLHEHKLLIPSEPEEESDQAENDEESKRNE